MIYIRTQPLAVLDDDEDFAGREIAFRFGPVVLRIGIARSVRRIADDTKAANDK